MQQADDGFLLERHDGAIGRRRRRRHAKGLTGQTAFAKEVVWPQHRDDRLFPLSGQHRQLDLALEDVEYGIGGISLREHLLLLAELHNGSSVSASCEESLEIEPRGAFPSHENRLHASEGSILGKFILRHSTPREKKPPGLEDASGQAESVCIMFRRGLRNTPFAMAVYPARRHPPNLRVRRFVPMLKGTRRPALALAVLLVLAVVPVLPVQAQTIRLVVDGQPLFFDQPPVVIGGRVLVPLRGVFERLGAFVQWDPASNTVIATRGDTQVRLTIGSRQAFVNQRVVFLDVPALIVQGRTLVPLRFVSEAMGARVDWDAATRTVFITSSPLAQ